MSYGNTMQNGLNQYPINADNPQPGQSNPGAGGKGPVASPSFGQGMDYTQMQNNGNGPGAPGTGGKALTQTPGQDQFGMPMYFIGPGQTTPGAGGKMNVDQFGQAIGVSPADMAQAKQEGQQAANQAMIDAGLNPADFSGPGLAGKSGGIDLLSPIAAAVNDITQPANPSINAMAPTAPAGRSPGAPLTGNFQPPVSNARMANVQPQPVLTRPGRPTQQAIQQQARAVGIPTAAPAVRPVARPVAPTARPQLSRRGAGRGGMIR